MNLCLSDEILENTVLTENEKKVLAALLYSYKVCSKSHDGEIIRSMSQLREDSQIKQNKMYEALRNLELLYHMVERISGETRTVGKSAKASVFKLNFEAIFNPPKSPKKFNFFEDMKSSETSMGTANTNTNANTNAKTITNTITNTNASLVRTIESSRKEYKNTTIVPVVTSTCSEKNKHRSNSLFLSDKQLEDMVKHLDNLQATDQKQYSKYLKQYQAIINEKASESQKDFWMLNCYPLEEL